MDDSGKPQAGVKVYALAHTSSWQIIHPGSARVHDVTDTAGHDSLTALPNGNYYLLAVPQKPANTPKQKPLRPGFYPGAALPLGAVPFTVTAGQAAFADIKLHYAVGHVVEGCVSDLPASVATKDVRLTLAPLDCDLGELRQNTAVMPNGCFRFADVPSGRYELRLQWMKDRKSYFTEAMAQQLEVGSEDMRGISVVYPPPLIVRAHVALENGGNVPTSQLLLMLHAKRFTEVDQFGPDGTLTIPHLEPGQYWIDTARVPHGYYAFSIRAGKQDAKDRAVDSSTGGTVDVEVTLRGGTGTITATVNGFPAGVVLAPSTIPAYDTNVQIRPVQKGRPVVFDDLPPGEYILYSGIPVLTNLWKVPEFISAMKNFGAEVRLGENQSVNVELTPAGEEDISNAARRLGLDYP